jgi:hypothetical protein
VVDARGGLGTAIALAAGVISLAAIRRKDFAQH